MRHSLYSAATAALLTLCGCSGNSSQTQEANATQDTNPEKMVIYQMMVRVFGNDNTTNVFNGSREQNGCGRMSDISDEALASIHRLGANYVWYTGIIQQATKTDWSEYGLPRQSADVVKGKAGSPYAICDYYAVSADIADNVSTRMQEFDALVERTHKAGMKVLIDFVPNHVAREYKSVMKPAGVADLGENDNKDLAFSAQNNFYYFPGKNLKWGEYVEVGAKVSGNDVFQSVKPREDDWYETVKLNYGVDYNDNRTAHFDPVPDTWNKMTDILLYWAGKGIDGFRCDMSEMVPSDFWHYGIGKVKEKFPGIIFVAEIYNPKVYEEYIVKGGFDYLYDKVELYDSIRSVVEGRRPIDAIQACLTLPTYTNEKVAPHMLNFLENHDEQRIASDFFGKTPQAGIPALYVSALINKNPYMHYFSGELGENSMDREGYNGADGRTTIFDYWGLERQKAWKSVNWDETKLPEEYLSIRRRYEEVFRLAQSTPAVSGNTVDITTPEMKAAKVFTFQRVCEDGQTLLVIANFGSEKYKGNVCGSEYEVPAQDAVAVEL